MRVRKAEAVNALLQVADEEAVCVRALAADEAEDGVLGGVNVLIFVHANVRELRAATAGDAGRIVAQEAQGELLQVREVHAAELTFGLAEARGELLRELNQRGHFGSAPIPILG